LGRNGPNEFYVTGSLRTWSIVDELNRINVPTLVTNGKYDEAQDIVVQPFVKAIPNVKWVKFEDSSHMNFLEEPEKFIETLIEFLSS
jgi:L-proline amide hydrolase